MLCILVAAGCGGGGGSSGTGSGGSTGGVDGGGGTGSGNGSGTGGGGTGSGTGGGGSSPPPPPGTSYIRLTSDAGDYVGAGASYSYSKSNAVISATTEGGRLSVKVEGDQHWQAEFQMPSNYSSLATGTYNGLASYPLHDAFVGGFNWNGEGRICSASDSSITITKVAYQGILLAELRLQFTQFCAGSSAALRGEIYWNSSDTTTPPGPTVAPSNLWRPAAGSVPSTGTYVYLQSQPDDFIGIGGSYLYTQANASIYVSADGGRLSVGLTGDEWWGGDFRTMHFLDRLSVGYYGNLIRFPFNNPTRGGLNWDGEGRGCNTLSGWFVVDSVTYVEDELTAIELRFEQHCEGADPALRGAIRYSAADSTTPAGPTDPPAGLWQPAADRTPVSGNYIYLESQPGDFIGAGGTYLYTQADAVLTPFNTGGLLTFSVDGDESWDGRFRAMSSLAQLAPGYYGDLRRDPFHNPSKGGLDWSGEGRGCNMLNGWFVVDSVAYDGPTLTAIDLRFEQHCEGGRPALHGKIHWNAGDTTSPAGPVRPPPALWQPAAGTTPDSGNFIYLESQPGDYIGAGRSYLYSQHNATLAVSASDATLSVEVTGDQRWYASFEGMNTLSRLEVGYYGSLQRSPFHNPTRGGLSWAGDGRGCNTLTGWFVVDDIAYTSGVMTAVDLRFEQHCEGVAEALRGQIHWRQ
jgi:hypothetical protein